MVKHFTRAEEYMNISNLIGKRLRSVKESAVSDPLLACNSSTGFDHFNILASDANKFRLLQESLLIKSDQPQLIKTITNHFCKKYLIEIFVDRIPPYTGMLV